jgi:pyridinium-3,5-bisthiocarboxylic acid mononucleotide nickel chelatase
MIKIAYLECQTGIAGDMCLGAVVDAGVPIEYLATQLDRLNIAAEYQLWAEKVDRNGQVATKVHVDLTPIHSANVAVESAAEHGHPHSHEHPHQHPHQHPHSHEHPHPPEHSHQHPHSHEHPHPHPSEHPHQHQHPHPTEHSRPPEYSDQHSHEHPRRSHPPEHSRPPEHSHQHPSEHPHSHEHPHPPEHSQPHDHVQQRNLPEIESLITAANLPPRATRWSLDIFRQLAIAEGAVHGIDPSEVHFHEVGAVDAIVDIVGTCLGLDYLDIAKVYCSPLPTGGGTVRAAHGILPVPVPAVLKLFASRQVPIYSNGIDRELVTPTGAAIAVTLATEFGKPPAMQLQQIGLGAGTIELSIPNMLRLWLGTESTAAETIASISKPQVDNQSESISASPIHHQYLETIEVLTTQIDDLNPQVIGYIFDRLFEAGAVDVFTQPIGMKKSRTGILLTVICPLNRFHDCEQIIFKETSTIGIRRTQQTRSILPREIVAVTIEYGTVRIKVARNNLINDNRVINIQPEYADCAAIAQEHRISWIEVYQLALMAWYRLPQ